MLFLIISHFLLTRQGQNLISQVPFSLIELSFVRVLAKYYDIFLLMENANFFHLANFIFYESYRRPPNWMLEVKLTVSKCLIIIIRLLLRLYLILLSALWFLKLEIMHLFQKLILFAFDILLRIVLVFITVQWFYFICLISRYHFIITLNFVIIL